jgi:hypothetical protein
MADKINELGQVDGCRPFNIVGDLLRKILSTQCEIRTLKNSKEY